MKLSSKTHCPLDSVIRIRIILIETIRLYDKCDLAIWWQKSSAEAFFPLHPSCSRRRWAALWRTTSAWTLTATAPGCVYHKAGPAPPGSPCAAGWWPDWWVLAVPVSYAAESPALSPARQSSSPCFLLSHSSPIPCRTWCSESGTVERKHTYHHCYFWVCGSFKNTGLFKTPINAQLMFWINYVRKI